VKNRLANPPNWFRKAASTAEASTKSSPKDSPKSPPALYWKASMLTSALNSKRGCLREGGARESSRFRRDEFAAFRFWMLIYVLTPGGAERSSAFRGLRWTQASLSMLKRGESLR
jgi:hypothetical protein